MFDQALDFGRDEYADANQQAELEIVYCKPGRHGWAPIDHMVGLLGESLSAPVNYTDGHTIKASKVLYPFMSRKGQKTGRDLLLIAPSPQHLLLLSELPDWRLGFRRVYAWIIDSFWTERFPKLGLRGKFDHFYVTSGNDVDYITKKTGVQTSYLSFGTDALKLGGFDDPTLTKDLDLLRMGRQPPVWEDDEKTAAACQAEGLTFHGRPPYLDDPTEVVKLNAGFMRRARFLLAHSNLVDGSKYTHGTKEYITSRWTDALGAGAIVAGIPPRTDFAARHELWPEALLDVSANNRAEGLAALKEALSTWTPELARHNQKMALKKLDWRWRFEQIAQDLDLDAPVLEAELAQINQMTSS